MNASSSGRAFCAYLALWAFFLWPLSAAPFDSFAYVGDSLATVYFIAENGRRLFTAPGSLFDAGIAYPHANASLFEAHRLLPAFVAAPLIALTSNPILVVNLLGALAYAFNAWAARRLALTLGISPISSFGAGALFAFHTYAVLEQPRLNIILLGFIPLAIIETVAFARTGVSKHVWRAAGLWLAQAYTENYSAIYGGALILFVFWIASLGGSEKGFLVTRLRSALGPAILAGLLFLPVALSYARMDAIYDFRREAPYSMDLSHLFATQPGNWLYGKIGPPVRAQQQGAHFLGFSTLLLAGAAVFQSLRLRRDRVWVLASAITALFLILLAAGRTVSLFGQVLMPGPYGWLYDNIPLFERTRIPERFALLAMLPLALLAARGVDLLTSRSRVLQAGLAAFLSLEHAQRFPWVESLPVGNQIPGVYRWLQQSDARAVVEAPAHGEGLVRMESVDMYFQLFHHKPVLSAYVSFPPLLTRILRQASEDLPQEQALRTLSLAGVDTIVYHQEGRILPAAWTEAESSGRLQRLAQHPRPSYWIRPPGEDLVFRIPSLAPTPGALKPGLRLVKSSAWRYRASSGRAALAGDGDPDTQWVLEDSVRGGESIEIGFGAETLVISGVALPLTRREILPTLFDVETRDERGHWAHQASYGPEKRDEIVGDLLLSPGNAVLVLPFPPVRATAVRLVAPRNARSFDGWRLSEIRVLEDGGD